jgi:hypothetical protein
MIRATRPARARPHQPAASVFVWGLFGSAPKGPNRPAQGNALVVLHKSEPILAILVQSRILGRTARPRRARRWGMMVKGVTHVGSLGIG